MHAPDSLVKFPRLMVKQKEPLLLVDLPITPREVRRPVTDWLEMHRIQPELLDGRARGGLFEGLTELHSSARCRPKPLTGSLGILEEQSTTAGVDCNKTRGATKFVLHGTTSDLPRPLRAGAGYLLRQAHPTHKVQAVRGGWRRQGARWGPSVILVGCRIVLDPHRAHH